MYNNYIKIHKRVSEYDPPTNQPKRIKRASNP